MKRTFGVHVLTFLLAWIALAGFVNTYVMFTQTNYGTPLLSILALLYGFAASAVAVGIWKLRPWAYSAFLAWAGICILVIVVGQFFLFRLPWPKFLGFAALALGLLWLVGLYVRKKVIRAL